MSQATHHLRLLFSLAPSLSVSSNPFKVSFTSSLLTRSITALRACSRVTVISSSAYRRGRKGGVLRQRRSSGSTVEKRGGERAPEMEETEIAKFNKKRAEGRDKNDNPKTLQLKSRKLNPINTICYVQILGTGMDTQDTSPSVLLFFDKQRFIFNSGEGLQRFCTEHKIKLSKIDHMFLTRVCSETAGGLPGLLLTLAGMGDEGMSVNIWGPSDLKYLVDAMRSFIPNAAMVHTHSFGSRTQGNGSAFSTLMEFTDPIVLIDDEVVRISAILLRPSFPKGCSYQMDDLTNTSFLEEKTNLFNESVGPSLQNSDGKAGSTLKPGDIAVIYVCELPEIKGKFDPAKAAALGLRPGPKYRELQLGNSVMSDHLNITVHPTDVLGHSIPGPIVLLVDCPTTAHLWELLSVQSLNCYYTGSTDHPQENLKSVNCIIHLGPASVTKSTEYQKWMKNFGGAQHIMAGHEIKNIEVPILRSSARITTRLHYMCPHLFPDPGFWSHQQSNFLQESNSSSEDSSPVLSETISAENLLKFHLRPYSQLGVDKSVIPSLLTRTEVINELLSEIPEIVDASKHISHFWHDSHETKNMTTSTDDEVIMVEEPWLQENACKHNTNMGNQPRDLSKGSEVQHDVDIPCCLDNISREDMEIVLLGTGSSQPSKYRNVSAIYVNLFSKGSLLLDCGEGTLAQLKRRFGLKGADNAVKSLRLIWISHIHADHHTGLARILALRCELLRGVPHEPLVVVGPRQLKRFLDAYSRLEDLDMQFLDCRHTTETALDTVAVSIEAGRDCSPERAVTKDGENRHMRTISQNLGTTLFAKGNQMQSYSKKSGSMVVTAGVLPVLMKLKEVLLEAGLEALFSVPVLHCPEAFGVVLKASERINSVGKAIPGWKLVYSGDTRPCQELIAASHGATILIHEATFEDDMEDEALQRNHSTTMEAIKVGTSAEAYRIILTHFSQRYPKIPVFNDNHMHKTCIAFDLMSVNVADLPVLPKVLPYLRLLFRNETILDESDDVQSMPCTDESGKLA